MKSIACFCSLLFLGSITFAQKTIDAEQIAFTYLKKNAPAWQLTEADIADVAVQQTYQTVHNGVWHVYLLQRHAGIEVFNAISNINILANGDILLANNRFVSNLRVNAVTPVLNPSDALRFLLNDIGFSDKENPKFLAQIDKNTFVFAPEKIAHRDITIKLKYQAVDNSPIHHLAWDIELDATNSDDVWSVRIDALTGQILEKNSLTIKCQFEHGYLHNHDEDCRNVQSHTPLSHRSPLDKISPLHESQRTDVQANNFVPNVVDVLNGGTYRVFALPVESPLYGEQSLLVNPADPIASPYGWHDTTGVAGAEFTTTRGNNAYAILDWRNTNTLDSAQLEPNGGNNLVFDYGYSPFVPSDSMRHLAQVNLFYMTNMMHDITFHYGFDERSGNYQAKNYSGLGRGRDYVLSQAQDGAKLADPTLNNANFSSSVDGVIGRIQMYLWGRRGARALQVTAPTSIAGSVQTGFAMFGPRLGLSPIAGDVVLFNDGSANASQACSASRENLRGKIAMIDRGTSVASCSYGRKVLNAQDSGAIAVIICATTTTTPNAFNEPNDAIARRVTIPSLILSATDCNRLKLAVSTGLSVRLARQAIDTVSADFIDGDFDNGIIAHEYGHGISTRLTGGSMASNCLNQGEQMGEGWSDFFALITTAKVGDRGAMRRGMGNFAIRQNTEGGGIRAFPYSTDVAVNPQTYNNIYVNQVSPHPIGSIWATTIWDLYWAMVDKYGFDANIKNRNSGNGKAIQLVMDGMKLQPCNPGFVDGRNAILAADRANYNGENQCLIWEVFTRRGLGYTASQGLGTRATDNIESFDNLPSCIKTVKLSKTVTPNAKAGDTITIRLKIINHKDETVTGLTLNDEIPTGTTFVSASSVVLLTGSTIQFALDSLRKGDSLELSYRLRTSPTLKSVAQLSENFEGSTLKFESTRIGTGTNQWVLIDSSKNSGTYAMLARGNTTSEQVLTLSQPFTISGTQPILRFFHRYSTEGGNDSGVLEAFEQGDTGWVDLSPKMFRNAAPSPTYLTFPLKMKAFWGESNGFISTYVDLSSYSGKTIQIRYRFKSNATTASLGWIVDDVLFMDMFNYRSTARLTSRQGDVVTAEPLGRGTIIEPDLTIGTKEIIGNLAVSIYPNPVKDVLNIAFDKPVLSATIRLLNVESKVLRVQKIENTATIPPLSMVGLPAGLYFLKIETPEGQAIRKVVKE
jgi:uncharacterized repeat protein (TIGR01451 family)